MNLSNRSWLFGLCLWCLVLLGMRAIYWQSQAYFFLPYNLGLAAIPWWLSHLARRRVAIQERWVLGLLWLLFFPNALYILTDLVHLTHRRTVPVLYDLVMLLSFAGTGAAMGFLSLRQMQALFVESGRRKMSWVFAVGSLFLASFGIYLGRVVRLNSWDVLTNPWHLAVSIAGPILDPRAHPLSWAMTLGLGVSFSLGYLFFTSFNETKDPA
jgi:uncharacterized membrane protein